MADGFVDGGELALRRRFGFGVDAALAHGVDALRLDLAQLVERQLEVVALPLQLGDALAGAAQQMDAAALCWSGSAS